MSIATRERPILFSGPMVRAILDGRKTQTRRAVKPQPETYQGESGIQFEWPGWHGSLGAWRFANEFCHYGVPGDRLWVRESFYVIPDIWEGRRDEQPIHYAADVGHRMEVEDYVGKPSIHMPRWASRITLEITGVRVERLQDIDDDDATAEGMDGRYYCTDASRIGNKQNVPAAVQFACLWDEINGKSHPWASNPWVWVVSFKKVDGH